MRNSRLPLKLAHWMLAGLIASLGLSSSAESPPASKLSHRLCAVLEGLQPGDRLHVTFEGELNRWWTFADPREPHCRLEVAPGTLVEVGDGVEVPQELERLLKLQERAHVVLAGELWGPELGRAPDPDLSAVADYAQRSPKRYKGVYWSKLVVHQFLNVQPVRSGITWEVMGSNPSALPVLIKAEMPTEYPRMAKNLGLSGEVKVQITIEEGAVVAAEVLSGDRLLVEATLANIGTWRFAPEAHARFTTTFVYELQNVPATPTPITVHADLPLRLRISAPRIHR